MSNFDPWDSFYVGDLDRYVSFSELEPDEELGENSGSAGREIDNIQLLAGTVLTGPDFRNKGLHIYDWKWELHQAEGRLRDQSGTALEGALAQDLLEIGKRYAIGRYARLEHISVEAAKAAALPFGIQALLHQFFLASGLRPDPIVKKQLAETFRVLRKTKSSTAYEKTGRIRTELHAIARTAWGSLGANELDRFEMRKVLSMVRLHFLVTDPRGGGFAGIDERDALYGRERVDAGLREYSPMPGRKSIPNWSDRHHFPLFYYYPIDIRQALQRGVAHVSGSFPAMTNQMAVNELALANCAIPMIKVAAKARPPKEQTRRYNSRLG